MIHDSNTPQASRQRLYSAGLSGKAGLLEETLIVLQRVAEGQSDEELRASILESDLLAKASHLNRRSVWEKIRHRYLSSSSNALRLAKMVMAVSGRTSKGLLVYYEFCCSEPVLFDAIVGPVYERFSSGFSSVQISDLQTWLDQVAPSHPEIEKWSPQTRKKVLSNILTILRDFGLMTGTAHKEFCRIHLPLPIFGYVLYRLYDSDYPPGPRGVIAAPEWQLFFQDESDVVTMLEEATTAGYCTFKKQGEVMTLTLTWPNSEAYVEAIARQVSRAE